MKFLDPKTSQKEINRKRFEVLSALAKGNITTQEAKQLCGAANAIHQKSVYVARGDAEYLRLDPPSMSNLSH